MKRYILIVLLVFSVHFAVPTLNQVLGISEILRENFRYGDIIFENNPISFQYLIIIQIITSKYSGEPTSNKAKKIIHEYDWKIQLQLIDPKK